MRRRFLYPVLMTILLAPAAALAEIEATKLEPADGATESRPPRSLRVFFSEEPDVEGSELKLEGPEGELQLEGLHTMGQKDLMVRVVGRVPDGEYTATWKTKGEDGEAAEGSWSFTVKRGGG